MKRRLRLKDIHPGLVVAGVYAGFAVFPFVVAAIGLLLITGPSGYPARLWEIFTAWK